MSRWISKFFGTRKTTVSRSKPRRPGVEALESRWCPAVSVTRLGNVLKITGDEAANQVRILHDSANKIVTVFDGATPSVLRNITLSSLTVDLKGGDDSLRYETTSDLTSPLTMQLNLGAGNDVLDLEVGHVAGVKLNCTGDLGLGNDTANVKMAGVVRGSGDVAFVVKAGQGDDRLTFVADNGQHAGAKLKADYYGDDGADEIRMTFDDIVTGKVDLHAHGGKGDDVIQIDAHARAGGAGSLTIPMWGDDGNDSLTLNMNEVRGKVRTDLNGGAGNDAMRATYGLPFGAGNLEDATLNVNADGGAGDDAAEVKVMGVLRGTSNATVTVKGGAGNDALTFYADNGQHAGAKLKADYYGDDGRDAIRMTFDDIVTGKVDLHAHGGKDDDTIQVDAHARAGGAGSLTVATWGDDGNDTMTLNMNEVRGKVRTDFSGGAGNDTMRATYGLPFGAGNLEDATLNVNADGGAGDDAAEVRVMGVLRGTSIATIVVKGGDGNDALTFYADNGQHAAARLKAEYYGDDGNDQIRMTFDDVVTGKVYLHAHGGKGDDDIQIDAHVRGAGSAGLLTIPIAGGAGNDTLILNMNDVGGVVHTSFAGGTGNDVIRATYGLPFGAGNLDNAKLTVEADGGDADDLIDVKVMGVLRGTSNASILIHGRQGNDDLRFYNDNGSHSAAKLNVRMNGHEGNDALTMTFDDIAAGTYGFYLDGGQGNDTIRANVHSRFGAALGAMAVTAVGGDGNDTITFASDEVWSALRLTLAGGAGNDSAKATFGHIQGAQVNSFLDLGAGDDRGEVELLGVLRDRADFQVRMDGGAGNDFLHFYNDNGSHAGATLAATLDGGAGNDAISTLFDDNMIGTYRFLLTGGAGDDLVDAILRARGGSTGSLQVDVKGGLGNDRLRLRVEDDSNGRLRLPRAKLERGGGTDTILSVTPNVVVV